jgi:di/tricarboxylate transporter
VITLPDEFREIIPARRKAPWAIAILTAMVALMALEVLPNVTAALLSAVALIVTRCVKLESVYRSISWQAVVLVAGILPLATALTKTGAAHIVAEAMVNTLGSLGPFAMLAFIFLITAGIGSFMSNTATAVLIAPIAIDSALSIGVSPQAFAMTVAIASSAAFVTPVASPVNTLVLEPGGYAFMDFVKVGLPLLFLTLVTTVSLAGVIYLL